MRKAEELLMTAHPALAKAGSISRAMSASSAAKITFGAPAGSAALSFIFATRAGIAVFIFHLAASA